jgi:lysophospholipase L1-like esterase
MLGMNDGGYKAETESNDEKYFTGYRHIIDSMRASLPGVRILAIEPSPYDDVTRSPAFPVAGDIRYNEVMRSFGKWIANYAQQNQLEIADLNSGVVDMLVQANKMDPAGAKNIIPDHIHPSFGGHLILAEELLKAW